MSVSLTWSGNGEGGEGHVRGFLAVDAPRFFGTDPDRKLLGSQPLRLEGLGWSAVVPRLGERVRLD